MVLEVTAAFMAISMGITCGVLLGYLLYTVFKKDF